MKLAHPAFLRPLAAEHRSHIVEFAHRLRLIHFGFDVGTHNARRSLRPERQRRATNDVRFRPSWQYGGHRVTIHKRIHLLLDDVRSLTDGAAEKLSLFQYGDANLGKIVGVEDLAPFAFNRLPELHFAWKNIRKAFDGSNLQFCSYSILKS